MSVLFIALFALHTIAGVQMILYWVNNPKKKIASLATGLILLTYAILFFVFITTPAEVLQQRAGFLISLYVILIPLFIVLIWKMKKKVFHGED